MGGDSSIPGAAKQSRRFLVVRFGAIGDCLRTLPAVRRLRRDLPLARIGWCVDRSVLPVLQGNPNVSTFHVFDRSAARSGFAAAFAEMRRLVTEVRAQNYEVVLDFHGRAKSGLIGRLSGAPTRIGYARKDVGELNWLFNNERISLTDTWENRVQRFLDLLSALDLDTSFDPADTGLYVAPGIRDRARRWYVEAGEPQLAVYPGTSKGRRRDRWPSEKWVELLARLGGAGLRSTVFWGPDETDIVAAIAEQKPAGVGFAPPTSLPEMMAMISRFRCYIGSDTAAMHMAWMQGVPTVSFASPKPVRTFAPLGPVPHRVLRAERYIKRGVRASKQPREVVSEVTVAEAFDAVQTLLGSPRDERDERDRLSAGDPDRSIA